MEYLKFIENKKIGTVIDKKLMYKFYKKINNNNIFQKIEDTFQQMSIEYVTKEANNFRKEEEIYNEINYVKIKIFRKDYLKDILLFLHEIFPKQLFLQMEYENTFFISVASKIIKNNKIIIEKIFNTRWVDNISKNRFQREFNFLERKDLSQEQIYNRCISIIEGFTEFSSLEDDSQKDDVDSALNMYLREISEYKLLTKQEEIELSKEVQKGNNDAREKMIVSNLRLCVNEAMNGNYFGLEVEDLIQEANFGLMKAVNRYSSDQGFRFSTYAYPWIKQTIMRGVHDKSRLIRIPVHRWDTYSKIKSNIDKNCEAIEEKIDFKKIANKLNLSQSTIEETYLDFKEVISYQQMISEDLSLEESLSLSDNSKMEKELYNKFKYDHLYLQLEKLKPKEKEILIKRFGLLGEKSMTLEEIGKEIGLTRERVRQIEEKALRRIKNMMLRRLRG